MKNMKGFTLIEILLSLSIVTILLGVALPFYGGIYDSFLRDNVINVVALSIRRAQTLSSSFMNESTWGVNFEDGLATVFAGEDYGSRIDSLDEVYELEGISSFSGDQQIIFERSEVFPIHEFTVTFTDSESNNHNVNISKKGTISVQ